VGRQWTIYPFGFRLKGKEEGGRGEEGIRTDWEHEGWEWHDPDAVVAVDDDEAFGGVPRLKESLRRVWFEGDFGPQSTAGRKLAVGLERLQTDHESGSRQLAAMALGTFREVIVDMGSTGQVGNEIWWEKVRMAAWHLWKNGRESMGAPILNALIAALVDIEPIVLDTEDKGNKKDRVLAAIDRLIENRKSTTARVSDAFASYIQENILNQKDKYSLTILTLSASSTIRDCIVHAAITSNAQLLVLRVLESRPLYEGVTIASSILSDFRSRANAPRVQITIYTDASAALASGGVDILLLGADRISSSGAVSNKTGSLPAVLSARCISPSTKVVVLSELEKVAEPGDPHTHIVEENNPEEITRAWRQSNVKGWHVLEAALKAQSEEHPEEQREQKGKVHATVSVKNIYFEWVRPEAINEFDAYVCEDGVLSVDDIRKRSAWVGMQIEKFFGSL
jgi:translation initiation factor 2B subunit (eIF-2B alpha/beta/delta family)